MKVAVLGYSGAGKSTLAAELGRRLGAPVLHLDCVQFRENWQERDRREANALVTDFLTNVSWVIDGNYLSDFSAARRFLEADWIILLLLPRWTCFFRAVKRYFTNRGQVRESMAAGCVEKLDGEFVRWLLWEGRSGERREAYEALARRYGDKTTVCRTSGDCRRLLQCLSPR